MEVSQECYRAAIGLFNCYFPVILMAKFSLLFLVIMRSCSQTVIVLAVFCMIWCDVELNPGPYENVNLKIAHLDIRSLNAPTKLWEGRLCYSKS